MPELIYIIIKFLVPSLFGSLIFFASVVAPTVFKTLDENNARVFLRSIFPKIYLYSGILSLIITIILFFVNSFLSFIFLIITIGYFYSRQFLMHKINLASDEKKQREFKKLHRFSVVIFVTQLMLMTIVYFLI